MSHEGRMAVAVVAATGSNDGAAGEGEETTWMT
jgi:hypothetical protein